MRTILVGLLLLITLAVAGLVGLYVCYTCTLPPTGGIELTDPVVPPTAPADDWRTRTLVDLAAAQRHLWDNTPIPYDTENLHYRSWAVEGAKIAAARAEQVKDYPGYFYTLAAYINGFNDPHFQFGPKGDVPPARWPGFIVARTGDVAEIVFREERNAAPPVGTKITACDGKPVAALLDERIFPFRLNPKLARDRRVAMTRLFFDRANPFAPAPALCRGEHEGRTFDIVPAWRPTPPESDEDFWGKVQAAGAGLPTSWGVSEPAPGVYWIGVPTFSSGDDTAAKLDALIKDVEAKGDAMRKARAIVIDTRGNGGGNSSWADKLAAAIFTNDVLIRHRAPDREQAVDWRGSPANAAFWRNWSDQMAREFGPFSLNRFGALAISWQLGRTARQDPPIIRVGSCKPGRAGGITKQRPKGESPFKARVFFLSNGTCGSSCLNFADTVLMVPGVKLIGSATSGDGAYMEIRNEDLPSKRAAIAFPQKVERGGNRAPLEAYEPDIPYTGPWSNEAVTRWVLEQTGQGK
jgi:hypothetical protein